MNHEETFESHTLLYSTEITQVRGPVREMDFRMFPVSAAFPRPPKAHMNEKLLSVSWSFRSLFIAVRLMRTLRGDNCKDWNRYRSLYQKWCFSKCQIIDTRIEPLNIWKLLKENLYWGKSLYDKSYYRVLLVRYFFKESFKCLDTWSFWKIQINWIIGQHH